MVLSVVGAGLLSSRLRRSLDPRGLCEDGVLVRLVPNPPAD